MPDELRRQTQLYGTTAEWASNDFVLLKGEIGIIVNQALGIVQAKVGDGLSLFSELPYLEVMPSPTVVAVPSPTQADQSLLSVSPGGVGWNWLDGGNWTTPTKKQALIRREFAPGIVGPPATLDAGALAVNFNGDLEADFRPSLYVGNDLNVPVRVVSQDDLLLAINVKSLAVGGGTDAANSLNLWPTPVNMENNELWVISFEGFYYILNSGPGRYGGTGFSGEGGPGSPITMGQLTLVGKVLETASSAEIVAGSGPTKQVLANSNLPTALLEVITTLGVQFKPASGGGMLPVITRSDGRIDTSLLPPFVSGLVYRGTFKPMAGAEYPTPVGSADLFVVGGLTAAGYTLTTGTLVGTLLTNGDQMIWNGSVWAWVDIAGSANVVLANGTTAMTGSQGYAGHSITALGTISMASGRYGTALNGGVANIEGLVLDGGTF